MKNRNIHIITLGCKVNHYESEAIEKALETRGIVRLSAAERKGSNHLSFCIVNTCTVTRKASMQSRQAVRKAIRSFPGAKVIVTGCYAQKAPEILRGIDGVQAVFGHGHKHEIPRYIEGFEMSGLESPAMFWGPAATLKQFQDLPETPMGSRSRPFLKIQDGCDAFCTYCIVPHVRGRSRSMPMEAALQHIGHIHDEGFSEVVLTGIHLGCYGKDLQPERRLIDLLQAIWKEKKPYRVRLSSIEPRELTDEIIEHMAMAGSGPGSVCRHVHVPLQSGDDGILKRMNRPYTTAVFYDRILSARKALPDAAIGVDVLVGFPGEDENSFHRTFSLLAGLPITYLHVFPYSPRSGTQAFSYTDRPSADAVHHRCALLRELGRQKRMDFFRRCIGARVEIVVEGRKRNGAGSLRGTTSNYIPVTLEGIKADPHALVQACIVRPDENGTMIAGPVAK